MKQADADIATQRQVNLSTRRPVANEKTHHGGGQSIQKWKQFSKKDDNFCMGQPASQVNENIHGKSDFWNAPFRCVLAPVRFAATQATRFNGAQHVFLLLLSCT